jgi:hypothetical protein
MSDRPVALVDTTSCLNDYHRIWRAVRVAQFLPVFIGIGSAVIAVLMLQGGDNEFLRGLPTLRGGAPTVISWLVIAVSVWLIMTAGAVSFGVCAAGIAVSVLLVGFFWAVVVTGINEIGVIPFLTTVGFAPMLIWIAVASAVLPIGIVALLRLLARKIEPLRVSAFRLNATFGTLVRARRASYSSLNRLWPLVGGVAVLCFVVVSALLIWGLGFLIDAIPAPRDMGSIETIEDFILSFQQSPVFHIAGGLAQQAVTLAVILAGVAAARGARRFMQRKADKLILSGTYSPIVFLRSFQDEDVRVQPISYLRRLVRIRPRLEEVVVRTMAAMGPPIAIGLPGERMPNIGAMRAYYDDDQWQAAFEDWVQRAEWIAVMAGSTPWAVWEMKYLLTHGLAQKMIIVIPSDRSDDRRQGRWSALLGAAAETPWSGPLGQLDRRQLRVVVFEPGGRVLGIANKASNQAAYQQAVRYAVSRLAESRRTDRALTAAYREGLPAAEPA